MKASAAYRALGAIDARSVARDSLLLWMAVLTPAIGLLFRFAVPPMAAALQENLGFDLPLYYPLVMSILPLAVAGMIGTVIGFLLLDQRDEQTLAALLVTPLSLGTYLRYQLGVLIGASAALSALALALAGLTETSVLQLVLTAALAAPLAPLYALLLGSFAGNKVQGFALVKVLGIVLVPCIAAYFVTGPWQNAFGLIPHYWALKVFWLLDGGATGPAFAHAAVGLVWQALLVGALARRFARVVRQ
jgi:fluoroquinolone transport system permease protein